MRMVDVQQPTQARTELKSSQQRYLFIKRAIDLLFCLLTLPFLLFLMAFIAIIIRLDSPGSPFFIQERIGKDYRPFSLYKFRTMWSDHDQQRDKNFMKAFVAGQVQETDRDAIERDALFKPIKRGDITRVGRFLRKASLDELPQIINILKGEMSLVGPRPNVPWEVDAYRDWHCERLEILPGITGLAQVHGRSNITFDEIAKLDITYIRNIGFKLDFRILWQTFGAVLTSNGAG